MSITYPSSLDNFPNPQSTDLLDNASPTLDHWTQHSNVNDAIEALEAKVGVDGSAETTSFDYKLSGVTGSDKAVSKTGSETLTNKTLTSPVINVGSDATGDLYYRSAGVFTRLPIGASGELLSSDGTNPEWIANPSTADASTTVKGVVEIATTAEITAGTGTGGTGAKLVICADAVGTAGANKLVQYDATGKYPAADGSNITGIPVYTTGTDIADLYYTYEAPILVTSSSTVAGWTTASGGGFTGGVGYARLFDVASTILISDNLPGTTSTSAYAYNKKIRIKFRCRFEDTSDRKGFGIVATAANISATQTDTTSGGIRFILNGSTLYAHNSNGTATYTDITSGVTVTNWNVYEIIFTPGVDAKFYINGTLKATHTTNLPSSGSGKIAIGTDTNGRAHNHLAPIISLEL